ncbi:hypothetical protein [Escherichia coli]|uniref:hypothetical protein n=1 Tax=Escherichia coli TaxID=562 RepID=UPI0020333CE3|nr:hypothetical protein [Escherichia coli]MCX8261261.1 hypothetical protein [Escherichia coli]
MCIFSTAVAAIPGGSGAVLRRRHRGSACCKRLSACGLRLKGLYARPASSGCGGSCRAKGRASLVPASQATAARPGPCGHAKATPGQAAVPQSAVPSLADSLPPAPADPAPWTRHAAGGGLAGPRHGLPETDLVESGMTGS